MKQKKFHPPRREKLASAYLLSIGPVADAKLILAEWTSELQIPDLDQVWLEADGSVSIEQVREFQRLMMLAPLAGDIRLGCVPHAQDLTDEASNALLKLLEDPPRHARFLLTTPFEDQILETIVSRCQRWHLPTRQLTRKIEPEWQVTQLKQLSHHERLLRADQWAKSDAFIGDFDTLLLSARTELIQGTFSPKSVERLLWYRSLAETNVNARLLAEVTLLTLGREGQ